MVEEVAAIFPLVHLLQPYMVDSAVFEKKEQLILEQCWQQQYILIDCKKWFTFFLTLSRSTIRTRHGSRGGGLANTTCLARRLIAFILILVFTGDTIVASLCIGITTSRTCITIDILADQARIRRTTVQTRSTTLCIVSGTTVTR
jgi:hypothetical protein